MAQTEISQLSGNDDDGLVTAATWIGGGLANALAGPVTSFAFGQMLNAIGLGENTGPVAAKLDQIITQIGVLQQTLNAFITAMSAAIAQVNYDVVAGPMDPLINANTTLAGLFQQLAQVDTNDKDAIASAKAAVNDVLNSTIALAPATWNTALCGTAGSTGVIAAWNRVAQTHYVHFGTDATNAIQQHWQFLDAQQALSAMYAVEYYNNQNNPTAAAAVISTWHTNRKAQLGLLRAMPVGSDYAKWTDPATKISTYETTSLLQFPPNCVVVPLDGAPLMCYLTICGPLAHGQVTNEDSEFDDNLYEIGKQIYANTLWLGGLTPSGSVDDGDWNPPPIPMMVDLLNYFGGSVGGSGADYFATALQNNGFSFPAGQLRLWTDAQRDSLERPEDIPYFSRSVFVDGDSWWNPSTDPNDTAMLLMVRRLYQREFPTYWYSS